MASSTNGFGTNGVGTGEKSVAEEALYKRIVVALEAVHSPRSTNELRHHAFLELEAIKLADEAPLQGFLFASDKKHPAVVRHYGLSLLEFAIRARWLNLSLEQATSLRQWAIQLAQNTTEEDPLYIRNKVVQLWAEIAKRSWLIDWMDMDEQIFGIWQGSLVQKELCLAILESLSESIFGREDAVAGLRGNDLSKAAVDIFNPATTLAELFPTRESTRESNREIRFGDEGWVTRISDLLQWCNEDSSSQTRQSAAVAALTALASVVSWAPGLTLHKSHCIQRMCQSMISPYPPTRLAAVEALYALYTRNNFHDQDITDLVCPLFEADSVSLLKRLYEGCTVDSTNVDEQKYLLLQKFSGLVHSFGRFLEERPHMMKIESDLSGFLDLLLEIARDDSLHVSIPMLHLWNKILDSEIVGDSPPVLNLIGPLLELCSQRLLRYEAFPEDSSVPSIVFLQEDVDTKPERHAFLGNYARFCNQIVESVVLKRPDDAMYHILSQADEVLAHLYDNEPAFDAEHFTKASTPLLRLDAQFSVIEAGLRGYVRNLTKNGVGKADTQLQVMYGNFEAWVMRLMDLTFEDPLIKQRVVQLLVEFAIGPLKRNPAFIFQVVGFILDSKVPDGPGNSSYSEAADDLKLYSIHQMQRLAMRSADLLATIYKGLEEKIAEINSREPKEQLRNRYSSILFIVTQRAVGVSADECMERLNAFVQPLKIQWQDPEVTAALSSFDGFRDLLGMGALSSYIQSRAMSQIPDWPNHALDEQGVALQAQVDKSLQHLPLHATKTYFAVSVDKADTGSSAHNLAIAVWMETCTVMMPNLLRLLSQAHAFHDPSKWTDLPPEKRTTIPRMLTDRFWQVGISSESRDDFYAKIGTSKQTLEGLASSIRATLRVIRETSYRILYCISLMGGWLYTREDISKALAKALYTDASGLSIHQTAILVELTRPIFENCPILNMGSFLPPMLVAMFTLLDRKLSSEWDKVEEKRKGGGGSLSEEMRDESILRQLTHTASSMIVGFLDPRAQLNQYADPINYGNPKAEQGVLRKFILATPEVLQPVIVLCSHILQMKDTRSSGLITRVLRSIVVDFRDDNPFAADVREFFSIDVMKAAISSLHDPYFVDTQNELAYLIAHIMITYTKKTDTPRQVLLSLPGMSPETVDCAVSRLYKAEKNQRQQRALVLTLLESLRGVSVSEQGRLPESDPRKVRSAMQERYMTMDPDKHEQRQPSPNLEGISDMFG